MRVLGGLALALLAVALPASAADTEPEKRFDHHKRDIDPLGWYVPDFVKLQTGSYVGMFNLGFGYAAFKDIVNWSFAYGYTPPVAAGRHAHSFNTDLSFRPVDLHYGKVRLVPV